MNKPPKIEAKCIFGHKFVLTAEQMKAAQELGCAICPQCGNAATVTKISGTCHPRRE